LDFDFVACKVPMFSFSRLSGADPRVGVEMQSEVACFGRDAHEAFLKAAIAGGLKLPKDPCGVLISIGPEQHKSEFLPCVSLLAEMGYTVYATTGTAEFFNSKMVGESKVDVICVNNALNLKKPNVISVLSDKTVRFVVNVPSSRDSGGATAGYLLRRKALDAGAALIFDFRCATMLVDALYEKFRREKHGEEFWSIESWHECHRIG